MTRSTKRPNLSVCVFTVISLVAPTSTSLAQNAPPPDKITLAEAVERALQYHPDALVAGAAVDAALASVGEFTASRLPKVSLAATATRHQEPMIVAPLHALDITRAPEFNRTLVAGSATMAYTLFDGGARGARISGARSQVAAAESRHISASSGVIVDVTNTYLRVLTYYEVLLAHDRRLEALEAERGRVALMFEEGTAAHVELLRVDAAISRASAERIGTETELEIAEFQLARAIGLRPDQTRATNLTPIRIGDTTTIDDRSALLALAEENNPEMAWARMTVETAHASRRVASASWLPSVGLFGGYLGFSSAAGGLTTEWQAGAKISYPLFTGGQRSATVDRTNAMLDVARLQLRQTELLMQEGLDRAISANRGSEAQVLAAQQAVDHQSEVVRIEKLALEAGAGTQTDYLRAQAELLQTRASFIEARYARIAARFELARVVGELNPGWLDRAVENIP